MYGESGDYRRIDRGYIPCVAEVEFQIIEKFPGDFSGDEDTTFPGSDVLPMVVSEVFGCDMAYVVGGDSPSVRVLVPEIIERKVSDARTSTFLSERAVVGDAVL